MFYSLVLQILFGGCGGDIFLDILGDAWGFLEVFLYYSGRFLEGKHKAKIKETQHIDNNI